MASWAPVTEWPEAPLHRRPGAWRPGRRASLRQEPRLRPHNRQRLPMACPRQELQRRLRQTHPRPQPCPRLPTLKDGTCPRRPSDEAWYAPSSPSLTTAARAPSSTIASAAALAEERSVTAIPVRDSASVWFGVDTSVAAKASAFMPAAGAGSQITVTFRRFAVLAAASEMSKGQGL